MPPGLKYFGLGGFCRAKRKTRGLMIIYEFACRKCISASFEKMMSVFSDKYHKNFY